MLQGFVAKVEAVSRASFLASNRWIEGHALSIEAHGSIVACIRARDPSGARAAVSRVLDLADRELHRR